MKYILSLACLVLSLYTSAQIPTTLVATNDINSTNWVTYVDNQEVTVEYKRTDCDLNSGLDKQYFLLRISNKTQNEISVNWEMDLFYNDDCKTCGIGEYEWQIDLAPHQSVEGECANGSENKLRMFSKFIDANYTNSSELTGFKFSNLMVN